MIGMAGGDGSQALVASVAAQRGIPMVIVPAGTRNHLALDLGLDRDDVVGAMDAFGEAVERRMDLADVNGHVFVNNVSLGLYAAIVRSPEYRDAKVDTALGTIPKVLAPRGPPVRPAVRRTRRSSARRRARDPGVEQPLRRIDRGVREPATSGHRAPRDRHARDHGRPGGRRVPEGARRGSPRSLRGVHGLVFHDVRGGFGRGDRCRPRRRGAQDGSATGLLDATGATPGPYPGARDRLLPCRHGDALAFGGEEPRSDRRRTTRDEPAVGIDLPGADDGIRTRDPHLGKAIALILGRPRSSYVVRLRMSARCSRIRPDQSGCLRTIGL